MAKTKAKKKQAKPDPELGLRRRIAQVAERAELDARLRIREKRLEQAKQYAAKMAAEREQAERDHVIVARELGPGVEDDRLGAAREAAVRAGQRDREAAAILESYEANWKAARAEAKAGPKVDTQAVLNELAAVSISAAEKLAAGRALVVEGIGELKHAGDLAIPLSEGLVPGVPGATHLRGGVWLMDYVVGMGSVVNHYRSPSVNRHWRDMDLVAFVRKLWRQNGNEQ